MRDFEDTYITWFIFGPFTVAELVMNWVTDNAGTGAAFLAFLCMLPVLFLAIPFCMVFFGLLGIVIGIPIAIFDVIRTFVTKANERKARKTA